MEEENDNDMSTIILLAYHYTIVFFIVLYTLIMVYICYYVCHKTDFCVPSRKQKKLKDIDLQSYLDSRVIE